MAKVKKASTIPSVRDLPGELVEAEYQEQAGNNPKEAPEANRKIARWLAAVKWLDSNVRIKSITVTVGGREVEVPINREPTVLDVGLADDGFFLNSLAPRLMAGYGDLRDQVAGKSR